MPETDGSMQLMMLMHKFQQSLLGASGHDEEIIALEDDLRVAVPLAARANACSSRTRRAAAPRHAGGIIPRGAVIAAARSSSPNQSVGAVCPSRPVAARLQAFSADVPLLDLSVRPHPSRRGTHRVLTG
jgi:hypothetical protein